tara:strand:+ start:596 stop:1339 length:744 start_codon:yes stop_codon:yes gene_type:complete
VVTKNYEIKYRRLIFIIMTQELKVYLNVFSKYLKTIGCLDATFEGDWYTMNLHSNRFDTCIGNNENSPIPMENGIEEWLESNSKEINMNQEGEDSYSFEVIINRIERTISVFENYSEFKEAEETGITINIDGADGLDAEPDLTPIIRDYCDDKECRGEVKWEFNGGGDSGFIESEEGLADFTEGNIPMTKDLEDMCYRLLENNYGGWEINEGSSGFFTLDLDLEQLRLTYIEHIEDHKTNMVYTEKF